MATAARADADKTGNGEKMAFGYSRAKDARFELEGLRSFFEYRDLGIKDATSGRAVAHVIRAVRPCTEGTGRHRHRLDFQMFYVLKGTVRFWYQDEGTFDFVAGDCVHQPPGILHELVSCSEDCELLEICLPGDFATEEA